ALPPDSEPDDSRTPSDGEPEREAGRSGAQVEAAGVGIPDTWRRRTRSEAQRADDLAVPPGDRGAPSPGLRNADYDGTSACADYEHRLVPVGPGHAVHANGALLQPHRGRGHDPEYNAITAGMTRWHLSNDPVTRNARRRRTRGRSYAAGRCCKGE